MAAGSAPIGREELASQVLESITKESKQFVSVSINKAMNALNDKTELDPKDIPHLATDSRLLPDLLKYGEKTLLAMLSSMMCVCQMAII